MSSYIHIFVFLQYFVSKIIKQDEEHVIYHYQYSVVDKNSRSSHSRQVSDTTVDGSRYVWLTGHWTVCSTKCGEGNYQCYLT